MDLGTLEFSTFLVEKRGSVLDVRLNRPEVRNALTFRSDEEWSSLLDLAETDPEIRVVTLTGNGPVFSAGHDLKETAPHYAKGEIPETMLEEIPRLPRAWYFRKPIVAGVHGFVGPGADAWLGSVDFVIAVNGTRFSYEQTRVGGNVDRSMSMLPFLLPMRAFKKLFMLGGWFDAETALQWQYVQRVVSSVELMHQEVARWADQLALIPPAELRASKENIRQMYKLWGLSMVATAGTLKFGHGHEEDKAFYQLLQEKGMKEALRLRDAQFDREVAKI